MKRRSERRTERARRAREGGRRRDSAGEVSRGARVIYRCSAHRRWVCSSCARPYSRRMAGPGYLTRAPGAKRKKGNAGINAPDDFFLRGSPLSLSLPARLPLANANVKRARPRSPACHHTSWTFLPASFSLLSSFSSRLSASPPLRRLFFFPRHAASSRRTSGVFGPL